MGLIGLVALASAIAVAGFALILAARTGGVQGPVVTLLKISAWLGLAAVLFAAKLFPIALMVLLAAGGVTGIEIWRERTMAAEAEAEASTAPGAHANAAHHAPPPGGIASDEEAASILGVASGASVDEVRAAHKRLIARLHPDQGGTDFLAAQINAARDRLIGRAVAPGLDPRTDPETGPKEEGKDGPQPD